MKSKLSLFFRIFLVSMISFGVPAVFLRSADVSIKEAAVLVFGAALVLATLTVLWATFFPLKR